MTKIEMELIKIDLRDKKHVCMITKKRPFLEVQKYVLRSNNIIKQFLYKNKNA